MGGGRGRRQLPERAPAARPAGAGPEVMALDALSAGSVVSDSATAESTTTPIATRDAVTAVRSMPGEASREGLHVLARNLIQHELPEDAIAGEAVADDAVAGEAVADDAVADDRVAEEATGEATD